MGLKPHLLEDPIVRESIIGVNNVILDGNPQGYISGGMGVQSYIPEKIHRPTVDLDFETVWPGGGIKDFERTVEPLITYLSSRGYKVSTEKKGFTFDISFSDEDDSFMLQHRRRSPSHYERSRRKSVERELSNRRLVNRDGLTYPVMAPEDIVAHKATRLLNFGKRLELPIPYGSPEELRSQADELRRQVASCLTDFTERDIASIRMMYDVCDILNLSSSLELDENYLAESLDVISGSSNEKNSKKLLEKINVI